MSTALYDRIITAYVTGNSSKLLNIPFIIEGTKKNFYCRGLAEWRNEKGWLTDTCLDGQDTFARLLNLLEIT